jgi:transcriptional regulator with GAF, ATPase, and Fis domain
MKIDILQEKLTGADDDELIGWDSGMKNVMRQILSVANFDSPVLLYGETGVGKEVIAKMIHRHSSRSNGPFIKVNCGAIPETLIDSELFGHEKGAFTGAAAKKWGRFERADKGTIFLDEISEMPLMAQTRLLHVLQNKEIERVGGSQTIKLDIRVIAATNRDLLKMSDNHEFRKDLWFRLNIYPIDIPPLRERKQDIAALIGYFIQKKCLELKIHPIPELCQEDLDCLMSYDWPGNVREVKNIVERALISNQGGALKLSDFIRHPMHVKMVIPPCSHKESIPSLDDTISETIRKALVISKGKISGTGGAADLLNTNPSTLRNKMKKLGISTDDLKKTMPRRFNRHQNNLDLDRPLSFHTH